jgi:hypothetical protein
VAARWQRPQISGSSKTGQPQAAAAENRPGPFERDFHFFLFLLFPPYQKRVVFFFSFSFFIFFIFLFFFFRGVLQEEKLIAADPEASKRYAWPRPYGQGLRFLASQGKRDKYSQETK